MTNDYFKIIYSYCQLTLTQNHHPKDLPKDLPA